MVPSLQQLALRLVPTHDLIHSNLTHLLGFENRLLKDICHRPITPIDEHFLSTMLDPGNTSFFWMMEFINRKIHHLPLNTAVFACWQEYSHNYQSMVVFAMRTHWDKVVLFVYHTQEKDHVPDRLFRQTRSDQWTEEDWSFLSRLRWKHQFYISSNYVAE